MPIVVESSVVLVDSCFLTTLPKQNIKNERKKNELTIRFRNVVFALERVHKLDCLTVRLESFFFSFSFFLFLFAVAVLMSNLNSPAGASLFINAMKNTQSKAIPKHRET